MPQSHKNTSYLCRLEFSVILFSVILSTDLSVSMINKSNFYYKLFILLKVGYNFLIRFAK
jgi:hypothetical protein